MSSRSFVAILALPLGLSAGACSGTPDGSGGGTTTGTGGTTATGGTTSSGGTTVGGTGGVTVGGGGAGGGGTGGVTTGGGGTGGVVSPEVLRGKYLVDHVIVCGQCHTPNKADGTPDETLYLAGSENWVFQYNAADVTVSAGNITNDPAHGLAGWTDAQIMDSLIKGIDDENVSLWPVMPYSSYAALTGDDANAVVAYLRTVTPSVHDAPEDTLADPDPPAPAIDVAQVPHTTLDPADPNYQSAEKGRYLATVACLSCHTPELSPGVLDMSKAFAGGRIIRRAGEPIPYTVTNITPDATGIQGWNAGDIAQAIKSNTEKQTARILCAPMPGGPAKFGGMEVADLKDIGTYLSTIPPIVNGPFKCQP